MFPKCCVKTRLVPQAPEATLVELVSQKCSHLVIFGASPEEIVSEILWIEQAVAVVAHSALNQNGELQQPGNSAMDTV